MTSKQIVNTNSKAVLVKKRKRFKRQLVCAICGLGGNLSRQNAVTYHSWCSYNFNYTIKDLKDLDSFPLYNLIKTNLPDFLTMCQEYCSANVEKDTSPSTFWYIIGSQFYSVGRKTKRNVLMKIRKAQFDYPTEDLAITYDDLCNMEQLQKDYEQLAASNAFQIERLSQNLSDQERIYQEQRPVTESNHILKFLKSPTISLQEDTFISYIDSKATPQLEMEPNSMDIEPFSCSICGSDNLEEDQIICCIRWDQAVHLQCYGLKGWPETEWLCEPCKSNCEDRGAKLVWQLWPTTEGIMKQIFSENSWCHVFWAQVNDKVIHDGVRYQLEQNDIYSLLYNNNNCMICKKSNGLLQKCQYANWDKYYHIICTRDDFIDKNRKDINRIFCPQHRPSQLKRYIELHEQEQLQSIIKTFSNFENWKKDVYPDLVEDNVEEWRPFNDYDDLLLEYAMVRHLHVINNRKRDPIFIEINRRSQRKSALRISSPPVYNILAPEVFIEDSLTIEGRSSYEWYKRYQDFLESKLIREYSFLRRPINIYQGRMPNKTKKKIKSAENKGLFPKFKKLPAKNPRERPPVLCTCNPRPKRFFPTRMYQCQECGANQHKIWAIPPISDYFICTACLSSGARKASCHEMTTSPSN